MSGWVDTLSTEAPCGTAACIAGFSIMSELSKSKKITWVKAGRLFWSLPIDPFMLAKKQLKLDADQAQRLFYTANHSNEIGRRWPDNMNRLYTMAKNMSLHNVAALVAVERINLFIKTNGAE